MAKDQRGPAIFALEQSGNPRSYWFGVDEDASEWLYEAVDDGGEAWVVKQLVIEPGGARHRYSWEALEDEYGFLAEGPLPVDGRELTPITEDEFLRRWRG